MAKDKSVYIGQELVKPFEIGELKYIVVGTGRSGTVYMAKLLTSLGLPCGHETIFNYDGYEKALSRIQNKKGEISLIAKLASHADEASNVNWFSSEKPVLIADSSYMAAPFLDKPEFSNVKVIHVVRDSLKVINSFVNGFEYFQDNIVDEDLIPYHEFIYNHVPELRKSMNPISRAALYYVRWNQMIESKVNRNNYFRFNVESNINKLCKFLKVNITPNVYTNSSANHKYAVENQHVDFWQISSLEIRNELIRMHNKYFKILI